MQALPKILLVADTPNWAFAKAAILIEQLSINTVSSGFWSQQRGPRRPWHACFLQADMSHQHQSEHRNDLDIVVPGEVLSLVGT
jgi:hypothetical protein